MELILDTETTRTILDNAKKASPSPYMDSNKLVSVQTGLLHTDAEFYTFHHYQGNDSEIKLNFETIQDILDKTTVLIGHNLKFDLAWIRECGFKYDGKLWDTQIFEHLVAKGQGHRVMPSLSASAERRGIELPKLDILNEFWNAGYNTDQIPLEGLPEGVMPPSVLVEFLKDKNRYENQSRETESFEIEYGAHKNYLRDESRARRWAQQAGKGFEKYAEYTGDTELTGGLIDYALRDIDVTRELYLVQKKMVEEREDIRYMLPALKMRNEFLSVLVDMERTGIHIDEVELERLEDEFRTELNDITTGLSNLIREYAGDKPYNISSPAQLSELVYGWKFKEGTVDYFGTQLPAKEVWKKTFDLGTEIKGGVKKKKYPKRLKDWQIKELMQKCMERVKYTEAEQCPDCHGVGHYYKKKKDGSNYKKPTSCKKCDGVGVYYREIEDKWGGFTLKNPGYFYATVNGFSVDKHAMEVLLERASSLKRLTSKGTAAVDFLNALSRLGSVENYLDSFIAGIRRNTIDGVLHTNFNQTVTATGRLSSSGPNFQNMPRANTFPVRKVVTSRWEGGSIISADIAQFEFRIAAFLSQCQEAIRFIKEGRDIHMVSAEYYGIDRQSAKAETFGPLFGKMNDYADHFYSVFPGIRQWHTKLLNEAVSKKEVRSPSGMIYAFPNATRKSADRVTGDTQIKNYPVQGLATGDLMPLILFTLYEEIRNRGLNSRIILTVHDDITVDCYPGEEDEMTQIFIDSFNSLPSMAKKYFNIDLNLPIDFDVSIGYNWMEKDQVYPVQEAA